MYQNAAMLATFLLSYSAVAGRIERSWISGPIVFAGVGFILGPHGHGRPEFSKSTKNSGRCRFREIFVAEIRPMERGVRLAVSPCCTATRGPSRDAGGTHRR
jgi:hypothetical protein